MESVPPQKKKGTKTRNAAEKTDTKISKAGIRLGLRKTSDKYKTPNRHGAILSAVAIPNATAAITRRNLFSDRYQARNAHTSANAHPDGFPRNTEQIQLGDMMMTNPRTTRRVLL